MTGGKKRILYRYESNGYNVLFVNRVFKFSVVILQVSTITNSYNCLGPVVQSIVSLTSSLRGQLVKCFMTL